MKNAEKPKPSPPSQKAASVWKFQNVPKVGTIRKEICFSDFLAPACPAGRMLRSLHLAKCRTQVTRLLGKLVEQRRENRQLPGLGSRHQLRGG